MGTTFENNNHRPVGSTINLKIDPRPLCAHCNKPIAIVKTKSTPKIGLQTNYIIKKVYYACLHKDCPSNIKRKAIGAKRKLICAENPHSARQCDYDFDVQAEVIRLRWQEKKTHDEIVQHLYSNNNINMNRSAVEPILKLYEYGCASTYKKETIEQIKKNRGIILCVDVMEPMKGREGILAAYDYLSGLALGSTRMTNGKHDSYEIFFDGLKNRITEELGVNILAICSDALPAQRIGIENIFKGVKHCICHFHFYDYVLKPAKLTDSHIVTQLRKVLRGQKDIKAFKQLIRAKKELPTEYLLLFKILEPLKELVDWERKPEDPCFTSLQFFQRVSSIALRLDILSQRIANGAAYLPKKAAKVVMRVKQAVNGALETYKEELDELRAIQMHLKELVDILSSLEESYNIGLKRLLTFRWELIYFLEQQNCGILETQVLTGICKYIETKGEQLMNYRLVNGAPNTNNFQELEFKHVKHIIRRTLGNYAAKEYLWSHGERIIFVKPNETIPKIKEILKKINQRDVRKILKAERRPHDGWRRIIRDDSRWDVVLAGIDELIEEVTIQPYERS